MLLMSHYMNKASALLSTQSADPRSYLAASRQKRSGSGLGRSRRSLNHLPVWDNRGRATPHSLSLSPVGTVLAPNSTVCVGLSHHGALANEYNRGLLAAPSESDGTGTDGVNLDATLRILGRARCSNCEADGTEQTVCQCIKGDVRGAIGISR